jgi:type II secretory pathway pseudopilin PulG
MNLDSRTTTAHARRSSRRGFTLVELMVSLVAGLIVTIAVVGLARTATTTFYEEARLSATEATVRSASERLRQDLSRAGFMSTGNIQLARNDSPSVPFGQKISHMPAASTSRYGARTADLQGIRIAVGGSMVATAGLSGANGLNPDAIQLTGNYTTDDSYRGRMLANNAGVEVKLMPDPAAPQVAEPTVARLIAGPDPDKAVRNAFTPGSQTGAVPPFLARVVDPRGCSHFVVISNAVGTAAGATITFAPAASGSPVLLPTEDQSTCGASEQEEVMINPVQTVRWSLGPSSAMLAPDPLLGLPAGSKFDLYREILDAAGASVGPPGGPQVVAEYAIDLKFGISVDSSKPATPPPANQITYDMDADGAQIALWTQAASGTLSAAEAPQRVRSVRFRLATRAALPDRNQPLSLLPGQPYLSRYCVVPGAPCTQFARVRTIMSEVALTNQAGMTY